MIHHVNDYKEFLELVEKSDKVVVDFFATWCGPCRMLAPVIEQIDQEKLINCDFVKVDVDEVEEAAARYGISSIPTIIIFKNAKPVHVIVGYRAKNQLVEEINRF